MTSFFERYLAGEYEQVWTDLLILREQVLQEPLAADALAVARETIQRARANIELLIPRLIACGYEFGYGWAERLAQQEEEQHQRIWEYRRRTYPFTEQEARLEASSADQTRQEAEKFRRIAREETVPFGPPRKGSEDRLAELIQRTGSLPMSLIAWYEQVGEVNFIGHWPRKPSLPMEIGRFATTQDTLVSPASPNSLFGGANLPAAGLHPQFDPLYVMPIEQALHEVQLMLEVPPETWHRFVPLAPDAEGKYFVSGGGAFGPDFPTAAIDASIGSMGNQWERTTFVEYLRISLRWAGLPGCEELLTPQGREVLDWLTEDLLPF